MNDVEDLPEDALAVAAGIGVAVPLTIDLISRLTSEKIYHDFSRNFVNLNCFSGNQTERRISQNHRIIELRIINLLVIKRTFIFLVNCS